MYFFAWVIKFFPDRVVFILKRIDLGVRLGMKTTRPGKNLITQAKNYMPMPFAYARMAK